MIPLTMNCLQKTIFGIMLFTWGCKSESPKQDFRTKINIALDSATKTTDRLAFQLLQTCLNELPIQLKKDTAVDLLYHKLGLYADNLASETAHFVEKQKWSTQAHQYYDTAYQIRQRKRGNHWLTHKTLHNQALNLKDNQQDITGALALCEKAYFDTHTDTTGMGKDCFLEAEILQVHGTLLAQLGDYTAAEAKSLHAHSIFKTLQIDTCTDFSKIYRNYIINLLNLGDIYAGLQNPLAITYFKEVERMIQKIPNYQEDYQEEWFACILNRGIAHRLANHSETATKDLEKAHRMAQTKEDSANTKIELAQLYLLQKRYADAEKYALDALKLRQDYPAGHPVLSEIHTVLGMIYLKINLLEKARESFKAVIGASLNAIHSNWQIEALAQLAALEVDAPKASDAYQAVCNALYARRAFFKTDAAKLHLTQQARQIFDKSISLNRQLHEKTGQIVYLNRIATAMEQSKAVLYSEWLHNSQINHFLNIPDALVRQERDFRLKLAQYERDSIQKNRQKWSETQQAYEQFSNQLAAKYPKYHQLKTQQLAFIDIAKISNLLPKKVAIIDYFLNDNYLHILIISNNLNKAYSIPIGFDFEKALSDMQQTVTATSTAINDTTKTKYSKAAYTLYKILLKQPLAELDTAVKLLGIIPDGTIARIPFNALMQVDTQIGNPYHYLLAKYKTNISYSLEETGYWKELPPKSKARYVFGGFSHSLKEIKLPKKGNLSLDRLPQAGKVVESVAHFYPFWQFKKVDTVATIHTFKQYAPQIKNILINAHAFYNDSLPVQSGIVCVDADSVQLLTIADLYQMDLSANELVTIVACETARGALRNGEGIFSVAQAFMYAGVTWRTAALWSIPPNPSFDLIQTFWQHIQIKQQHPMEALGSAQWNYLKNENSEKYPSAWAGQIAMGSLK